MFWIIFAIWAVGVVPATWGIFRLIRRYVAPETTDQSIQAAGLTVCGGLAWPVLPVVLVPVTAIYFLSVQYDNARARRQK